MTRCMARGMPIERGRKYEEQASMVIPPLAKARAILAEAQHEADAGWKSYGDSDTDG